MNDIGKTEKKCISVGCEAIFVLDTEILFKLRTLGRMMQIGSEAWWKLYLDLCDKHFEQCYQGVTTPDVSIMNEIEKHPEYKKWLKDFGITSIAELKRLGEECKTVK